MSEQLSFEFFLAFSYQLINLFLPQRIKTTQHFVFQVQVSTTTIIKMSTEVMLKITLVSNDYVSFVVDQESAKKSVLISDILADFGEAATDITVPLVNVNEVVLRKVIEWCDHHKNDPATSSDDEVDPRMKTAPISEWDQRFMQVDQDMLFELILAANYLNIKALLDLGCKTVANMIKGKTPKEIRKTFNIVNDFTPEEEEQIRIENEWCEDR
ncbi:hypothetical protein ACMFMG_003886 [Clarireedia jacksonii]